jgi:DNA-binding transcriptional regulator YiaG
MQTRILLVAGVLSFCGCNKPQVSPQEFAVETSAHTPGRAPEGTVYLLRRVAVATDDTLRGFAEGSEAKVIEERSEKLLVEIEGMQFEISREEATNDLDQRDAALARASEREAVRLAALAIREAEEEDRKFLAEENARRRSFAETKIAHLRSAIESAREEIARLETESNDSVARWERQHIPTRISGSESYAKGSDTSAEENARQERIAALQTHIANCDREIRILSDTVTATY